MRILHLCQMFIELPLAARDVFRAPFPFLKYIHDVIKDVDSPESRDVMKAWCFSEENG